jgi:glyoxylase-like metal-dependent hydrolase (beta-lactamase superfamily II)
MDIMSEIEQVHDDLFVVRHEMRPGWSCNVLVFFGEKNIGIVDTAFEETIRNVVFPLILEQDRSLDEIDLVVNTHRDGDHIKGNGVFKEKTSAIIAAHRLEAKEIPYIDRHLEDGDTVTLGDRVFRVIHTPGHRPGAICLFQEESGLLVTDDVVCGTREDLIRMDKQTYIESLRKLQKLETDTMIMSHPFMPAGKDILKGNEAGKMIEASIRTAEKP